MSQTVEELANRIVSQTGVSLERARLIARANLSPAAAEPLAPHLAPSLVAEQDGRAEDDQQNDIIKLWLTLGGKVWNTSSKKRAKITPGWSDLMLTLPRWSFLVFWETKSAETVKRKNGGRSPEQLDFAEHVEAGQANYGSGTFRDFVNWLLGHLTSFERRDEVFEAIKKAGLSDRMAGA